MGFKGPSRFLALWCVLIITTSLVHFAFINQVLYLKNVTDIMTLLYYSINDYAGEDCSVNSGG